MSRHLVAKFRRSAAPDGRAEKRQPRGEPGDDWRKAVLPHTERSMDHFDRRHGGGGSLPVEPGQFRTKFVNHGETRYALQAMDSTDGWSEWSLHRQVGPDINDPDHWERIGMPPGVHQFCHCAGDGGDEVDLSYPAGVEDDLAGYTDGSHGDRTGMGAARAEAERAFERYISSRGRPGIGDYDINQIMRDEGFR